MGKAALTSLWLTLPCVVFLGLTSAQPTEVKAKSGGTACLPCQIASNVKVVEWSRPDLNPECVLLYQNKKLDPDSQNPSFKNRVDLQDRQMKDGNVSLILKDVTIKDAGTYECRVLTNRRKRGVDPIHTITLIVVDPPGQPQRHAGLMVSLSLVVLFVSVVGFLINKKHKQQSQESPQLSAEQCEVEMSLKTADS